MAGRPKGSRRRDQYWITHPRRLATWIREVAEAYGGVRAMADRIGVPYQRLSEYQSRPGHRRGMAPETFRALYRAPAWAFGRSKGNDTVVEYKNRLDAILARPEVHMPIAPPVAAPYVEGPRPWWSDSERTARLEDVIGHVASGRIAKGELVLTAADWEKLCRGWLRLTGRQLRTLASSGAMIGYEAQATVPRDRGDDAPTTVARILEPPKHLGRPRRRKR